MLVTLLGELTIAATGKVKPELVAALCRKEPLEIDCSGVTEVDVAGLQLLLAAQRSAKELGLALILPPERCGPAMDSALTASGLGRVLLAPGLGVP